MVAEVTTAATDVVEALRRHGVRDVDDSSLSRALYSTDASLYRVVPRVVARPRDIDEVMAIAAAAVETGTPITARGAGTSIAGNAVGTGIVVDFARHMNRVLAVDEATRTAEVQPGVVHAALQRAAAPQRLRYGPDPSTHTRCTVGGMIGNNACGNRALGYGRSADNVAALDLLTIGGERIQVGRDVAVTSPTLEKLRGVVGSDLATVRTEFGRFGRQVSGYSLEHLLPERGFDVGSFMAGTEGTLALLLGATVDLVKDPTHRHLVVLAYPSMAEAADHTPAVLPYSPTACEGLGARIVEVYRAAKGDAAVPDLPDGGGYLYVELSGDDAAELEDRAAKVVRASGALAHRHVTSPLEQGVLWRIREEGAGLAGRALDRPALSGWEDAAVPPERLGAYLREFDTLMNEYGVHGVPFGHFGDGCVHVRIDFELDAPDGHQTFRDFLFDAARLAASHGGSFSGEHGDGRARSELLPLMYSPKATDLFSQVKHVFDPENLLNPGVLVEPRPVEADLRGQHREWAPGLRSSRQGLRLLHDEGSFGAAVHRCTGVGKCLAPNQATGGVMCPSFQATRQEKDSTRGRARVLQEMVDGRLVSEGWASPEVHEALDLCLSCKGCLSDCPTGVDMATYKSEVLYQTYRGKRRPRSHYILGRLPFWARLNAPIAGLANLALRIPGIVHVARWVAGVDQRRSLPRFATRTLSRQLRDHRPRGDKRVLLWADSFTEYFGTASGRAAVDVLEAAGYAVELLERPQCCGLTWITTGQLDTARELVERTVEQLHPYVAAGVPVVGLEPSCLAVLRSDAVELVDDPRAAEVAGGVLTLAELLRRDEEWEAPDLSGRRIIVQPHCHHSSVLGFEPDLALLESMGAQIQRLGGCCGLAGNFGVEKGHYEVSVGVAEQQLLPALRDAQPGTIVLADGFSCRTQIDDLTDVDSLHLAELLARELR
ncbi:FAD-binding oxidoreductase [Aeromicrobium camelliae]|uniref:FAD-binding oxidoreductase n=1 Tax=Aeromicrobium camelliae TaxID=1538144 RepID=A0A3N6X7K3_9ACTN|nr:FAD-binding and (Fe-S)-binding domain-containing protein [Aeromicrobium camelliae]RQN10005.1 FAD-binding oxidoreductase [Aeromicrobium camelliae]